MLCEFIFISSFEVVVIEGVKNTKHKIQGKSMFFLIVRKTITCDYYLFILQAGNEKCGNGIC